MLKGAQHCRENAEADAKAAAAEEAARMAALAVGTKVAHPRHGVGEVVEVRDGSVRVVTFDAVGGDGETHRYRPSSLHKIVKIDRPTFEAAVAKGRSGGAPSDAAC